MSLIFVAHDTPQPAQYGAMAAILAARLHSPLAYLEPEWDLSRYPDARQHVTAAGVLVTSGLIWHERLGGRTAQRVPDWAALADLPEPADGRAWVIPLGPSQLAGLPDRLKALADRGISHQWVRVEPSSSGLVFSRGGTAETDWGYWRRDRFGRWTAREEPLHVGPALRIALLGSRRDQWDAYPATLAALGDAADGMSRPVDIQFVSPLATQPPGDLLRDMDGVLLPGGSAMANVAGQIAAARYTLANGIPTLGLCLGMQTMATAVAQAMLGSERVNLAEADPDAAIGSFVALADTPGLPAHRLGEHLMLTHPGDRIATLLGPRFAVRYNHRFHLNPALKGDLERYGLSISATDSGGTIADGIEFGRHAFYLGVQGHPELSSAPGRPHPLLTAFLAAAARTSPRVSVPVEPASR